MIDSPLGNSPVFAALLNEVSRLAAIDRPILVVGERGTGKELIVQRLHYLSPRWDKPMVQLNCASLSESLLDSELFGHEAGAFTGAVKRRAGRFERAHGGSLFLDEIATASLSVQEKLLRVVEYGEFERLGATETASVDVRLIAATNVDLPALAESGRFRADLLDRLAFAVITVPPLRARPDDILLLAEHFALSMATALKQAFFPGFSKTAERALINYGWPGNVRELKNVVERAVASAADPEAPIAHIDFDPFASPWRPVSEPAGKSAAASSPYAAQALPRGPYDFTEHIAAHEQALLIDALAHNQHQQKRTAAYLGLQYHQLRNLLRKYEMLGPVAVSDRADDQ